jgi:hypothetical protein
VCRPQKTAPIGLVAERRRAAALANAAYVPRGFAHKNRVRRRQAGRVLAQKRTAVATSLTHNKLAGVAQGTGRADGRAPSSDVRPAGGVPGSAARFERGRIGPAGAKTVAGGPGMPAGPARLRAFPPPGRAPARGRGRRRAALYGGSCVPRSGREPRKMPFVRVVTLCRIRQVGFVALGARARVGRGYTPAIRRFSKRRAGGRTVCAPRGARHFVMSRGVGNATFCGPSGRAGARPADCGCGDCRAHTSADVCNAPRPRGEARGAP